jgi:hypothetical protein
MTPRTVGRKASSTSRCSSGGRCAQASSHQFVQNELAMSIDLESVSSPAEIRLNVGTFDAEAPHNLERAVRLLRDTTYWVYDPDREIFAPSKFVGYATMSFERYVAASGGDAVGARFDGGLTHRAIESALGASYRDDQPLRQRLEVWGVTRFGLGAFGNADRSKWRFITLPEATLALPKLRLALHGRYSRKEVYALFGIDYDTRGTPYLNVGLSPAMPDGGYFLFITLDKATLAERYAYEDVLFRDQLVWVTRRGVEENDSDYVALREPTTRVSLFVRRRDKQPFAYLGEVRATEHEQFTNEEGRSQQRYLLALHSPVPSTLMVELTEGAPVREASKAAPETSTNQPPRRRTPGRRPASLDDYQRAFRYVLGTMERQVVPAHQHYQMRLRRFLADRGVSAEWERDFIDVRWQLREQTWIGEVKVTRYLTIEEAFRTALGQLLVYAAKHFATTPGLVMFLDTQPAQALLSLATRLNVAVVVETAPGVFELASSSSGVGLRQIFGEPGQPSSPN